MNGINLKAVAIGALIDVGGTFLSSTLIVVAYAALLVARGVPEAELEQRMLADQSFYTVSLILGLGFLLAGAYTAARIARTRELLHGGIVGGIAVVVGLLFLIGSDPAPWPAWYLPVSFGLTLPVAVAGGALARRRSAPVSPARVDKPPRHEPL